MKPYTVIPDQTFTHQTTTNQVTINFKSINKWHSKKGGNNERKVMENGASGGVKINKNHGKN